MLRYLKSKNHEFIFFLEIESSWPTLLGQPARGRGERREDQHVNGVKWIISRFWWKVYGVNCGEKSREEQGPWTLTGTWPRPKITRWPPFHFNTSCSPSPGGKKVLCHPPYFRVLWSTDEGTLYNHRSQTSLDVCGNHAWISATSNEG